MYRGRSEITAPPRPPRRSDPVERDDFVQPSDPVGRDEPEALIEEARQRARRRRRIYAAAVAALALLGGLLLVAFGRPGPSQSAASESDAGPGATGGAASGVMAIGIFNQTTDPPGHPWHGYAELYLMNPDGSGLRLLTRARTEEEESGGGVLSPDGRKILTDFTGKIMVVNTDGSGERVLVHPPGGYADSWSPDGQRIALTRAGISSNDLWISVMNPDGSGEVRLAKGGGAVWSPDGRKIAYWDQHSLGVAVMNADGSGKQVLTSPSAFSIWGDGPKAWSPDRTKIFFERALGLGGGYPERFDLYVMNADGSGQQRLAKDAHGGALSPDGQKIVFTRHVPGRPEGIYLVNPDGSGERKLADGAGPVWSPDGQWIAFGRDHAVWVMNADGSGQQRLTINLPEPGVVAWSPSSRTPTSE